MTLLPEMNSISKRVYWEIFMFAFALGNSRTVSYSD
jgi:hypothetical protein